MVHGVGGHVPMGQGGNDYTDYNASVQAYFNAQESVSNITAGLQTGKENPSKLSTDLNTLESQLQSAIDSLSAACGGNPMGECAQWINDVQDLQVSLNPSSSSSDLMEALSQISNLAKPPCPWMG